MPCGWHTAPLVLHGSWPQKLHHEGSFIFPRKVAAPNITQPLYSVLEALYRVCTVDREIFASHAGGKT